MAIGKRTDPALKQEILRKIRDEGMSVTDASNEYDVNSKTIYYWLRSGIVDGNRNLILENRKLKKEIEQLYKLLGRATAEMQRPKR
jgi:transposase-like protein